MIREQFDFLRDERLRRFLRAESGQLNKSGFGYVTNKTTHHALGQFAREFSSDNMHRSFAE